MVYLFEGFPGDGITYNPGRTAHPMFRAPLKQNFVSCECYGSAQCIYIASKYAQGEYLMNVADDIELSPAYLDQCLEMIQQYKKNNEKKYRKFKKYSFRKINVFLSSGDSTNTLRYGRNCA